MEHIKSYFKPKSVTWWAGIAAITIGAIQLTCSSCGNMAGAGSVMAALLGSHDGSPVGLIALGAGLVGLRAKMDRADA